MNEKCKILIITDTYVGIPGGSERHLYNFLSGVPNGFEIDVFQFIPSKNPMLNDGQFLSNPNIHLYSRPLTKIFSFNYFKIVLELFFRIFLDRPDFIVSYHEKSEITNYLISLIYGRKVISISSKRDQGFKLSGRLKGMIQFITPKFDYITAPSNSIKNWLIEDYNVDADKVSVINNGVDLSKFPSISELDKQTIKSKLGINEETNIMTIVACLKPVKGHQYLINGFSDFIKQSKDDWKLILIGDGELRQSLESQVNALDLKNNVRFMGYQNNVHEWLLASDIALSSSLSEGLSNALIEACAASCPIIATKVGGNPEVVVDGHNGFLVKAKDSESIKESMLILAGDIKLRKVMSMNARHKAITDFSNEAMVNALAYFYLKAKNIKINGSSQRLEC